MNIYYYHEKILHERVSIYALPIFAITIKKMHLMLTVYILFFQFDTYVKSLNIEPQTPMFRIVTDGQLPIRQCLHREASIKDIELPEYYNVFHDLRKDFSKFYNAPQDQTFNSITDLVNCILLNNINNNFQKKNYITVRMRSLLDYYR